MKFNNLLITIILIGLLTSCSDWLELDPAGKVVVDEYWQTEEEVEAVVYTCYREMLEDAFMKRVIIWGELRSDNMVAGSGIGTEENYILNANILPSNSLCDWSPFYEVINYCNIVMYYAPGVVDVDPNLTTSELNSYLAEVMTLRALCYFYLVRTYNNVPLVTEPSISDDQDYEIAQSSEEVVLDTLINDLIQAEEWAKNGYSSTQATKGRITKDAVRALLADIYLWNSDYEKCIEQCNLILENEDLEMVEADEEPYYQIFGTGNSTESIFELQFSTDSKSNSMVTSYYGSSTQNEGKFCATPNLAEDDDVYDDTDDRKLDFIKEDDNNYDIAKYATLYRTVNASGTSSYSYRTSTCNWIVYRLTDVMLMKAEALVELNRNDDDLHNALSIVNKVYIRSNPTIGTDTLMLEDYSSQDEMQDLVLDEKRRETLFEGQRWFDLLRMARRDGSTERLVNKVIVKYTENQTTIESKMSEMNALYLPVYEDELNANSELEQNPFYVTSE